MSEQQLPLIAPEPATPFAFRWTCPVCGGVLLTSVDGEDWNAAEEWAYVERQLHLRSAHGDTVEV